METKYISLLFLVSFLGADVIPPGVHWYDKCAEITNADSLGDTVLVCYSEYAYNVIGNLKATISQDTCLPKCYRNATYYVFWSYRDSVIFRTLNGFDYEGIINGSVTNEPLYLLSNKINPNGGYIEDAVPLVQEELYYRLCPGPRLALWKKVSKFSDLRPDSTEYFDVPTEKGNKGTPQKVSLSFTANSLVYRLPASEGVTLNFFDPAGKLVARLSHSGTVGKDNKVALPKLPAGTYLVKLTSAHYSASASVAIRH